MSARPWYKRYPSDFIAATMAMSLEEKGAYSMCLDLIYDHGGPIQDEPQWIARVCGCSTRKWKIIRAKLIEMGKLHAIDGLLSNERSDKQLENQTKGREKTHENGPKVREKSHESSIKIEEKTAEKTTKSNKNNDMTIDKVPKSASRVPEARSQRLEIEEGFLTESQESSSDPPDEIMLAIDRWNDLALTIGLPVVQKITPARIGRTRQRLADVGGLAGWDAVIDKIRGSPFLRGESRGFTASFDWVTKSANFTKIMEGNYDDRKPSGPGRPGATPATRDDILAGIDEGLGWRCSAPT